MNTPISKADLHIHTAHSDGAATVEAILTHVANTIDLRVIAITDHDEIAGAQWAARLARSFGVEVVVGEEVSTAEGHLLALFIERALPAGRPAAETIAAIHAQGGLAIAPHPYDRSVPSLGVRGNWNALRRLDAVEGFNAGVIFSQRGSNRLAQRAAHRRGLPLVGGSDAHTLATIGRGYTTFPGTSASDLYRAIQRGTVHWDGNYWHLGHYLDMGRQLVQRHGLRGTLQLAAAGAGVAPRLH